MQTELSYQDLQQYIEKMASSADYLGSQENPHWKNIPLDEIAYHINNNLGNILGISLPTADPICLSNEEREMLCYEIAEALQY